jgi:NNP family nitrate/nitrite transporter-like MFS transporter
MIPSIFDAKSRSLEHLSPVEQAAWSRRMSGALIGIAGAIGALGGVGINIVLRASYLSAAKSATMAFWVFLAFYVLCAVITWFAYVRRPTKAPEVMSAPTDAAVSA